MQTQSDSGEANAKTAVRIEPLALHELRLLGRRLFGEHYEEVARNKRVMVLDPDWHRYRLLADQGLLFCLGAFTADMLVGYSVTYLDHHMHYSGLLYAQNDVLFVDRDYRAGRLGLRLIAETERVAAERGARLVLWHAKQGTALDALLPRLGYQVQDIIYSKELA